jgi:hypothetical protein
MPNGPFRYRNPICEPPKRSPKETENSALMGPWNPWLHEPKFGKPIWELGLSLSISPSL